MKKEASWKNYLWIGLIGFLAFLLEYFTIFVIDGWLLNVDIINYTPHQRGVHCIITAAVWLAVIIGMLAYTRTQYGFPVRIGGRTEKIAARDWAATLACFAGCKILTFLDWHTWKVIGEAKGKDVFQFCSQYLYYLLEVGLVLLIIVYGQKASEMLLGRESNFPFGGMLLALTWGGFHFVSRGVGIEVWNGISCMIFSILAGIMYLKVRKNIGYSYLLIALGYLL